jgi:hypothetical protein
MNKRGQVTIITLLGLVVLLMVFVGFLPAINEAINATAPYLTDSPMALALIMLIPTFIVIAIIQSIFSYNQRGA